MTVAEWLGNRRTGRLHLVVVRVGHLGSVEAGHGDVVNADPFQPR
jgi:hypothetical protein